MLPGRSGTGRGQANVGLVWKRRVRPAGRHDNHHERTREGRGVSPPAAGQAAHASAAANEHANAKPHTVVGPNPEGEDHERFAVHLPEGMLLERAREDNIVEK